MLYLLKIKFYSSVASYILPTAMTERTFICRKKARTFYKPLAELL